MQEQKPTLVRYYLPERGWYHGWLIRSGYKWALIRTIVPQPRNRKIAVDDVREVERGR